MKLLHISDLHLGKRVNEFSMLEDQHHILELLLALCEEQSPDALLIAGDIYDRAVPPAEAVALFDEFLTALAARSLPVLMVSGNHDSAERLGFGGRIFSKNHIFISGPLHGGLAPVTLTDQYGPIHFYLLPFLRPPEIRGLFPGVPIESYEEAVRAVLEATPLDTADRNVLLAHQFFVAEGCEPLHSDSETARVGGLDQINAALLDGFDYVALGHLHGPQRVGREAVRYSGSPLKYSFSETHQQKGATLVELGEKGDLHISLLPLTPLRDMREMRGPLRVLLDPAVCAGADTGDYIRAILTDEDDVVDAMGKLRAVYPNIMRLDYDNARTRIAGTAILDVVEQKSALELFREFYLQQNGAPLTDEKERIITTIFGKMEEGGLA